jgi:rRNA-processing protein FCF1
MTKFLITKTVTAELEVECENEDVARTWAQKIVATLEDSDGMPVELAESMEFYAYSRPSECIVEVLS